MTGRLNAMYIVTIEVPAAAFRAQLGAIEGARLIRELPPDRVVVAPRTSGVVMSVLTTPEPEKTPLTLSL